MAILDFHRLNSTLASISTFNCCAQHRGTFVESENVPVYRGSSPSQIRADHQQRFFLSVGVDIAKSDASDVHADVAVSVFV
jgi:hypothetical protein